MKHEIEVLLSSIPDVPEWSLTRYLLSNDGDVVGDQTGSVVLNRDRDFLSVIGMPTVETLARVLTSTAEDATILVQPSAVSLVQAATGLPGEHAELCTLGGREPSAKRDPNVECTILGDLPAAILDSVLRGELEDALEEGKRVSAAWADGQPVAFCYSVGESAKYWDVSIDTLEAYRRRGLASQAFLHHYDLWKAESMEAVWGAAVDNPASGEMARRLGFQKAAEIWEFNL